MLLSEQRVWEVVGGKSTRRKELEKYTEEELTPMTPAAKKAIEKSVAD